MPRLWYCKDGEPLDVDTRAFIAVTLEEAAAIARASDVRYLGNAPPGIRSGPSSMAERYVIIEREPGDPGNEMLSQVGFFLVARLRPVAAEDRLYRYRRERVEECEAPDRPAPRRQ